MSFASSFDLQWPEPIENMISTMGHGSSMSALMAAFDCKLVGGVADAVPAVYKRALLIMSAVPIILGLFAMFWFVVNVCWAKRARQRRLKIKAAARAAMAAMGGGVHGAAAHAHHRHRRASLSLSERLPYDKFVTSAIVFLYLAHPELTRRTLMLFHCTRVGDELRMTQQLDLPCYDRVHSQWILMLAFPAMLLFIVGIPALSWNMLHKHVKRKSLHADSTRFKLGFLYAGYKTSHWYWEIIVMGRKVLIIFIGAFFAGYGGTYAQSLIVLGVIALAAGLHVQNRPYGVDNERDNPELHRLELFALLTQFATFFFGLLFYTPRNAEAADKAGVSSGMGSSEGVKIVLTMILMTINVAFLVYILLKLAAEFKKKHKEDFEMMKRKMSRAASIVHVPHRHSSKGNLAADAAARAAKGGGGRRRSSFGQLTARLFGADGGAGGSGGAGGAGGGAQEDAGAGLAFGDPFGGGGGGGDDAAADLAALNAHMEHNEHGGGGGAAAGGGGATGTKSLGPKRKTKHKHKGHAASWREQARGHMSATDKEKARMKRQQMRRRSTAHGGSSTKRKRKKKSKKHHEHGEHHHGHHHGHHSHHGHHGGHHGHGGGSGGGGSHSAATAAAEAAARAVQMAQEAQAEAIAAADAANAAGAALFAKHDAAEEGDGGGGGGGEGGDGAASYLSRSLSISTSAIEGNEDAEGGLDFSDPFAK